MDIGRFRCFFRLSELPGRYSEVWRSSQSAPHASDSSAAGLQIAANLLHSESHLKKCIRTCHKSYIAPPIHHSAGLRPIPLAARHQNLHTQIVRQRSPVTAYIK